MLKERVATIFWFSGTLVLLLSFLGLYRDNAELLKLNCPTVLYEKAALELKAKKLAKQKPAFDPDAYLANKKQRTFEPVDYDPFLPTQLDKNFAVCDKGFILLRMESALPFWLILWAFSYLIGGFFLMPPVIKAYFKR